MMVETMELGKQDLSPTQRAFHQSPARFRAMIAGVGAGKTFMGCLETVMTALWYPGSSGTVVASTYRSLKDFVLPMIQKDLWEALGQPGGWDELCVSFNKQDLIANLANGSTIYFRSCDQEESLAGPNLGFYYIDEAARVKVAAWRIMVARLRLPPERGWITTTPKGRNWVWDEFVRQPRDNYAVFTGASMENPHLSPEYIESLKESYGEGSYLEQQVHAKFVAWEGLVYPNVSMDRHHLDAPAEARDYKYALAGVDFGWTDPTVILVGLVGMDGAVHIVEEFYEKKVSKERLLDVALEFKERWGVQTFWCDPSRPDLIQAFRPAHLDARRGKNDIDPGIMEVSRLIDSDLFKMDWIAAPNLAREFECYSYAEDDHGKFLRDKPQDKDNHACDALRYLVYSQARQGHASSTRGFR